jgi:hypothetical protein
MSEETIDEIFTSLKSVYAQQKKSISFLTKQRRILKDKFITQKADLIKINVLLNSKLNELDTISISRDSKRIERKKHIEKILQIQDEIESNLVFLNKMLSSM